MHIIQFGWWIGLQAARELRTVLCTSLKANPMVKIHHSRCLAASDATVCSLLSTSPVAEICISREFIRYNFGCLIVRAAWRRRRFCAFLSGLRSSFFMRFDYARLVSSAILHKLRKRERYDVRKVLSGARRCRSAKVLDSQMLFQMIVQKSRLKSLNSLMWAIACPLFDFCSTVLFEFCSVVDWILLMHLATWSILIILIMLIDQWILSIWV